MKRFRAWWTTIWFEPIDPRPLSLFRVALGILLIFSYAALAPNWNAYYGADGILSLHDADLIGQRPPNDWWCLFTWTEGWLPIRVYWWVGLLAALAFTAGCYTRTATWALYLIQTSIGHRTWVVVNGEDSMFRWMLLFAGFMTLDARYSLQRWWTARRRGKIPPAPTAASAWPVRMAQLNVAAIYLFSVWDKLWDPGGYWVRGEAVYYSLTTKLWGGSWPWLRWFYGNTGILLNHLATYGSLAIEVAFPLLVWWRRTRLPILLAATALHLTLAALIPGIRFFNLALMCTFLLFLPVDPPAVRK